MADSHKALTYIHLPVIEKDFKPGDEISAEDLAAAEQDEDSIKALVDSGALGGEDDEIDPSHIIPDPAMPTITSVVAQAKAAVEELEEKGEDVPDELRAVANLDFTAVTTNEEAKSSERSG
jgi:hypothetical protein